MPPRPWYPYIVGTTKGRVIITDSCPLPSLHHITERKHLSVPFDLLGNSLADRMALVCRHSLLLRPRTILLLERLVGA